MTTLQGKSAFPEITPLLGASSAAGSKAVAQYLKESDLIFGAGSGLAVSLMMPRSLRVRLRCS